MPAETINIRQDAVSGQQYRVPRRITKKGYLTSGYLHFPPGCAGFVDVRVSLEIGGSDVAICPIPDFDTNTPQFIAIDDFTLPFPIERKVSADDVIVLVVRNGDAVFDHDITMLAYWYDKKPEFGVELMENIRAIVGGRRP